ncbi:Phosphoribulokinase [Candidatus Hydrogenisulfobacillus filiaventi]|uniref:Phosphoribulokinase n=1 Tax=Candidatus Hydrogenisulfobacillus filiaventi TaxID=2707344 RepID=A0A6F8ZIA8_9FIRM|nr:phosphoribulokinase [Bacillota bacterium]CAB1129191.1 Phosphoribulokinase [Candidatus Hydrogenisulfobacillus filiaventi]
MASRRRVTILGIAGDSGAGKSTYAAALRDILGEDRVTVISLDDYHSLDRRERNLIGVTALHPWKANNLGLVVDHVWALRQGRPIRKPTYDHSTGMHGPTEEIVPKDIIILEGLHTLYLERLRDALDLRIYFDTDTELRVQWKVRRDSGARGYTPEEVMAEIERRRPDVEHYIEPQKAFADIVIHYLADHDTVPTAENPEPVRVRFAERLRGSKRRLVKWLALAGRLGLISADHFHDRIIGEEVEIASLSGITDRFSLHSLIEMVSDRHLLSENVTRHLNQLRYDPVAVSRILVASMISHLSQTHSQEPEPANNFLIEQI